MTDGSPPGFSLGFVDDTLDEDQSCPAPGAEQTEQAYILKRLIGRGGQADVWEAWQTSLNRTVALKIHRGKGTAAFLREARLTGELDHPNIVPVFDAGATAAIPGSEPSPAIAMKLVSGKRWDDLLASDLGGGRALPPDRFDQHLRVLVSVCRAVGYAHSRGVVHLDLKPGQVMVGDYGEVYLMDWGVAARLSDNDGPIVFSSPSGTPGYMAPEQALGDNESVGIATDVYLLGGLAFHIVTGRCPHPGVSVDEQLAAARRNDLNEIGNNVSAGLRRILARALETNPQLRHESADAFRRDIERFLAVSTQREEARQIVEEIQNREDGLSGAEYAELSDMERRLDRAAALAPQETDILEVRDRVLSLHVQRATDAGDLELARITAERITGERERDALLTIVKRAEATREARERQRRFARLVTALSLVALAVVLAVSAAVSSASLTRAESNRRRAEESLRAERERHYQASIQAAQAQALEGRYAEARASLADSPAELRAWEWGALMSQAHPENFLIAPREHEYTRLVKLSNPDGVAALRGDGSSIAIYNHESGEVIDLSPPEQDEWTALGASESRRVILGTRSGRVFSQDGEMLWAEAGKPIRFVASTADGAVAASANAVWFLPGDSPGMELEEEESVSVLSAGETAIALGTTAGRVHWISRTSQVVTGSVSFSHPVTQIVWNPDGSEFVAWATDQSLRQALQDRRAIVWAIGDAEPVAVLEPDEWAVTSAAWTPDGGTVYIGTSETTYYRYDRQSLSLPAQRIIHGEGIPFRLLLSPLRSDLVTMTRDRVFFRNKEHGYPLYSFRADSRRINDAVHLGDSLAIAGAGGGVGLWGCMNTDYERLVQTYPDRAITLDVPDTPSVVVSGHPSARTAVWGFRQNELLPLNEPWLNCPVTQVRVSAKGDRVLGICSNGEVRLVEMKVSGEFVERKWSTDTPLTAAALSRDGSRFWVSGEEGGIHKGMFTGGESLAHTKGVVYTSLEFDDAAGQLIAAEATGFIHVLNEGDLQPLGLLEGHSGNINRLVVSKNGEFLVSASDDETACLWDPEELELLAVYRGTHAGPVTSVAMTPDGERVLTSSIDSRIRVFDRETEKELLVLDEHRFGILDMVLDEQGRWLYTTGQDGFLRAALVLPWGDPRAYTRSGDWLPFNRPANGREVRMAWID